jgi:hypothetical protein
MLRIFLEVTEEKLLLFVAFYIPPSTGFAQILPDKPRKNRPQTRTGFQTDYTVHRVFTTRKILF